jgi:hypothetical protein
VRGLGERVLGACVVALVLMGSGAAALLAQDGPDPAPASAPAAEFSAERAWAHLEQIGEGPHPIGSPRHEELRQYLQAQLEGLGGTFEVQRTPIERLNGFEVSNLMVRFPGTDPTGTVLLATHYDSVPAGPGVGDAGVSVASLVETARAIAAAGPLRNDVIILLTDGEEAGLFGGRAFVDEHPWAQDVDLAFNFEGRGVSGVPIVAETEHPTVELMEGILDATPPLATSPIVDRSLSEAYTRRISDFAELKRLDIQGAHIALVGESLYYHSPLDDLAHSSRSTLQHMGETALGLARHFGDADLAKVRAGSTASWAVAFPGIDLVIPTWLAWPLLFIALALALLVARRVRDLGTVATRRELALGVAVPLLCVVAAVVVGGLVVRLIALDGDADLMLSDLPVHWHNAAGDLVHGYLFLWAALALATAAVVSVLQLARRRLGAVLVAGTSTAAWAFALVLVTLVSPATGAIFSLAFIGTTGATLLWLGRDQERGPAIGSVLALAALGAPVVMLGASLVWLGYLGTTLTGAGLLCGVPAVTFCQLHGQLDVVGRVHRWLPTALLAGAGVVLLIVAVTAQQTDADLLHFVRTSSVWGL